MHALHEKLDRPKAQILRKSCAEVLQDARQTYSFKLEAKVLVGPRKLYYFQRD